MPPTPKKAVNNPAGSPEQLAGLAMNSRIAEGAPFDDTIQLLNKIRTGQRPPRKAKKPGSDIDILLQAQAESKRKNYDKKIGLIRSLMLQNPQDFSIDQELNRFYGVTHAPTGFRLHLPRIAVPHNIARPVLSTKETA